MLICYFCCILRYIHAIMDAWLICLVALYTIITAVATLNKFRFKCFYQRIYIANKIKLIATHTYTRCSWFSLNRYIIKCTWFHSSNQLIEVRRRVGKNSVRFDTNTHNSRCNFKGTTPKWYFADAKPITVTSVVVEKPNCSAL